MAGKSKDGKDDKPATHDPAQMMTVQPFMPNMQSALASQLAMGFGGTPQQYSDSFNTLFQPMQIPNYAAGAPLVPGPAKDPKKTGKDARFEEWFMDNINKRFGE